MVLVVEADRGWGSGWRAGWDPKCLGRSAKKKPGRVSWTRKLLKLFTRNTSKKNKITEVSVHKKKMYKSEEVKMCIILMKQSTPIFDRYHGNRETRGRKKEVKGFTILKQKKHCAVPQKT